ncbi:light-harvesting complex-like protein OHP2, chloroplastic isoform X2 [Lotus japonicus]|uniref:light-harvesting complex-like protein OHP2, chloroplastic isoform X2 n=1 Tax=Lotus japonicus TaxID=34305 RepID=UPI0025879B60|nr:light-harvesting complex-like protein OHP2, chloroplastic isoform X2 [Lotus japonicus]
MSLTSSIPCIKIPTFSSTPSTSSYSFRFSSHKTITIRNSQAEGPLRRPVTPSLREPPSSSAPPPSPTVVPPPQKPGAVVVGDDKNVVSLEFQRKKAKELQEYFKQKKLEEANQGPLFGFIGKNETGNGRNLPRPFH